MPPYGRRQGSEARLLQTQWGGSRPAACPVASSLLPARATRDLTDPLSLPVRDKGRRSDDGRMRFRIRTRRLFRDARLRGVGNRSHHQMTSKLPFFVGGSLVLSGRRSLEGSQQRAIVSLGQVEASRDCSHIPGVGRLAVEARRAAPRGHHIGRDGSPHDSNVDLPLVKSSPCIPKLTSRIGAPARAQQRIPNRREPRRRRKDNKAGTLLGAPTCYVRGSH